MAQQPLVEITSSSFARSERFSYWADVVAQKFVPLECDSPDRPNFQGTLRHRKVGLVGISDVQASAMSARRTPATIALAQSEDLIVVLHLQGTSHVGQNSDTLKLRPGEGAMVATDECYFFEFPDQFRQLVLKVPKRLLADERLARKRQTSLGLTPGGVRLLERVALSSLEDPLEFSAQEEAGIERAIAELLQSAIRPTRDGATGPYAEARMFIRRHLADPNLKPELIATELKMSRRTLARLFANQGTTIERAIWSDRLAAIRRDILDPRLYDHSITAIAFSWAFNDAAHFSRSFSRTYGLPPSKYRATHTNAFCDEAAEDENTES
jgi:AraC-like DNA-binding protein